MKKIFIVLFVVGLSEIMSVNNVLAIPSLAPGARKFIISTPSPAPTPTATGMFKLQKELNVNLKNILKEKTTIMSGKVTQISGTSLSVEKDGSTYLVNTSDSTKYRRRFWGVGKFSEISVGDTVDVYGTWANDAKTEINARFIRDLSIQMRYGAFFGTVKTISETEIVIDTYKRNSQIIIVTSETKLVNRKMEDIKTGDILIGHRIRVKGLWNNNSNTITEVKQIKDFSIPNIPSPSASPKED
jgi:hypothetical protein